MNTAFHQTRSIMNALIGTKVRITGDHDGWVTTENLHAIGFSDDDIYEPGAFGKRSDKCQAIIEKHYTISHVDMGRNGLLIGIKEFDDKRASHHIDRFELVTPRVFADIEPEHSTERCNPGWTQTVNPEFDKAWSQEKEKCVESIRKTLALIESLPNASFVK